MFVIFQRRERNTRVHGVRGPRPQPSQVHHQKQLPGTKTSNNIIQISRIISRIISIYNARKR